jgi:hypothetical protein
VAGGAKPQLASWDRAGHPSQVKLARFLAQVDAAAGPVLATVSGRVAVELIVGFSDGVSLTDGGHDLDNYLFSVAQRLSPERVAAIFGRKIHGPSSLAMGPAEPDTAEAIPQFSTRMAGSHERRVRKQHPHDRLAVQAAAIDPVRSGRQSRWRLCQAATGPASGSRSAMPLALCRANDPARPFQLHDDRIVSLGLHHTIDAGIAHDVIIDAWWTRP